MAELAWVEREAGGFVVKRRVLDRTGEVLVVTTSGGQIVLVLSELEQKRLDDASVLRAVALSLIEGGTAASAN